MLVEEALASRPSLRRSIEPLLAILQATRETAAAMHRQMRAMAGADADCRRLMTTPLRGLLAASLARIGSKASWPLMASGGSTRWLSPAPSTSRRASATAGPSAPISGSRHDWPGGQSSDFRKRRGQHTAEGRHQSGKSDHTGKISRPGDMRSLLFEAAQCLVFRSSRAAALKAWFEALAVRVGRNKALVALARKLAVILHAMLINRRDFDETLHATAAAA